MMSNLATIQKEMKAAILGDEAAAERVSREIVASELQPIQRLQIHKNNYRETLTEALRSIFQTVTVFVGEQFVAGALAQFVLKNPPQKAQLVEYGCDFGQFLDSFEHAKQVPYIADIARLDWAIHSVQNAAEVTALDGKVSLEPLLESGRLRLVPQLQLVTSKFPILSFWMVGTGKMAPEAVHVEQGGQNVLVIRINGAVQLQALDEEQTNIITALQEKNIDYIKDNRERVLITEQMIERGVFTVTHA